MSTAASTRAAAGFSAAFAAALLAGCAALPPPAADLAGTNWRVVAINGAPVPAAGGYSMHFDTSGGVGARFGCNHMGGRYRLTGSTLTISNMATTLMGCPEPQGTHEQQASAILAQPMQVSFTSSERMGLSNAAGSIALDPLP
ncbi:MAG TPA: META domain-containing protein [Sphingomicrobium sp.]|nr:META domain-containing protein [Sphingomicrobium sp.]